MRSYFADWAAHNSANMDYISREQYEKGLLELSWSGDMDFFRPSVWEATDKGTEGQWVRPREELTTRGWAYNVFNITNTADATYRSYSYAQIEVYFLKILFPTSFNANPMKFSNSELSFHK